MRRALTLSGQRSLELSISPGLLARMVVTGRWSVAAALAHIERSRQPAFRSAALVRLAESDLPLPCDELLALAGPLPSAWQRADVLVALAPRLPEDLLPQALGLIRAFDNPHAVGRAISALAPRLPDALQEEALLLAAPHARLFPNNPFAALIPYLSERLLPLALELAAGLPATRGSSGLSADDLPTVAAISPHAELLQALLPRLPASRMLRVIEIAGAYQGGEQLLALAAPHLPEALIPAAFELVRDQPASVAFAPLAARLPPMLAITVLDLLPTLADVGRLAAGLVALAPALPAPLLSDALRLARAIGAPSGSDAPGVGPAPAPEGRLYRGIDPREPDPEAVRLRQERQAQAAQRVRALAALAAELPPVDAAAVVAEAFQTALSLEAGLAGSSLLLLAPQLSPDLLPSALAALTQVADLDRAPVCAALAPTLPDALLPSLVRLLARTAAGGPGERALAALAPRLSVELLTLLLSEALPLGEPQLGAIIGGLAPHLPPALLAEAQASAQAIGDPHWRARALLHLTPRLSGVSARQACSAALGAVAQLADPQTRFELLSRLVPCLPAAEHIPVCDELIRLLPDCPRPDLRGLIPVLPEASLLEAITAVREHQSVAEREATLAALEARLPAALLDQALAAVPPLGDAALGAAAVAILAPHRLTAGQMGLALQEVGGLLSDYLRAAVLLGLAPYLPPALMGRALASLSLLHAPSRAAVITALAPRLPGDLLGEALAYSEVGADDPPLEHAIGDLAARHLAGRSPAVIAAAFLSDGSLSLDRLRRLARRLPLDAQPTLLGIISAEPDGRTSGKAISALAPQLADGLLPEALDLAYAIDDLIGRAWALAALAPRLPEADRQAILAAALAAARAAAADPDRMSMARSLEDALHAEDDLGMAVVHCAPHLTAEQLPSAVAVLWTIWEANLRRALLGAFGRALPAGVSPAALELVRACDQERDRTLLLLSLAPCLDPAARAEARALARTITAPAERRRCLEALSPAGQAGRRPPPPPYAHPAGEDEPAAMRPPPPTDELLNAVLEALTEARLQDRAEQQAALQRVGAQLAALPPADAAALRSLWAPLMASWSDCERPALLRCIIALAPWLAAVTTRDERELIAEIVQDELRRLP